MLGFGLLMTGCGSDDNAEDTLPAETNSNRNDASAHPEAARLEMPHLKGNNSILIIHKTADNYDAQGVNYCVEWDVAKKSQRWSCYQLNSRLLTQRTSRYYSDDNQYPLDEDMQANYYFDYDYFWGSGFDHGHVCPSADRLYSREANYQTFYLTNMQPQYKQFNSGLWAVMEDQVRQWARSSGTEMLYICKGGTIDKESDILTRVKGQLIVPKYFFMALLLKNANGYRALAFWAQNERIDRSNDALSSYVISIDELETRTGIDFFCNLPDDTEKQVEANVALNAWGLK